MHKGFVIVADNDRRLVEEIKQNSQIINKTMNGIVRYKQFSRYGQRNIQKFY